MKVHTLALATLATSLLSAQLPPYASPSVTNAAAVMAAHTFQKGTQTLGYRLFAPASVDPARRYPLVLFLHGAGERGSDNAMQLHHGVWPMIRHLQKKGLPVYILAPQCPANKQWVDTPWSVAAHRMNAKPSESMDLALQLLDETVKKYPVDTKRIYVTGISMGGYGTWDALQRRGDFFAAGMPVCGGGDMHAAWRMRNVPIWAFHGDRDGVVVCDRSRQMVSALWQCGGKIRYREYPGVGHNCWVPTYDDAQVLDWLFSQKRP